MIFNLILSFLTIKFDLRAKEKSKKVGENWVKIRNFLFSVHKNPQKFPGTFGNEIFREFPGINPNWAWVLTRTETIHSLFDFEKV